MSLAIDFEHLLKQAIGLDAGSVGSATIERGVRQRMACVGTENREDYWHQVRNSDSELDELVETVVVPETWFFRDPEAFAVLTRLLTEECRQLSGTPTLRVLSIPCSTGEEPYSIVMSLLDAGLAPERFQVEAVDISRRALSKAACAVYGGGSFRGQDIAFRDRYFQPGGAGHVLMESVRNKVRFRQGNLLSDDLLLTQKPYDVIFCRNVLIYFDRHTQGYAMRRIRDLLTPSGLLFAGPAETFLASSTGFTAINHPLSFAFRRSGMKAQEPVTTPVRIPVRTHKTQPPPRSHRASASPSTPPLNLPASQPGELSTARDLADAGRLLEAVDECTKHLRECGDSAEAYYLLGLAKDALGSSKIAAEFYKKAIYLKPNHVEALTHLALIRAGEGDMAAAGRLRERARRADQTVGAGRR